MIDNVLNGFIGALIGMLFTLLLKQIDRGIEREINERKSVIDLFYKVKQLYTEISNIRETLNYQLMSIGESKPKKIILPTGKYIFSEIDCTALLFIKVRDIVEKYNEFFAKYSIFKHTCKMLDEQFSTVIEHTYTLARKEQADEHFESIHFRNYKLMAQQVEGQITACNNLLADVEKILGLLMWANKRKTIYSTIIGAKTFYLSKKQKQQVDFETEMFLKTIKVIRIDE